MRWTVARRSSVGLRVASADSQILRRFEWLVATECSARAGPRPGICRPRGVDGAATLRGGWAAGAAHERGAMGLLRKAIRRSMPKPVKQVRRTVNKATHPVSNTARAITPKPVKRVSHAAYSVTHPIDALQNAAEDAVLDPVLPEGRSSRSSKTRSSISQPPAPPVNEPSRPVSDQSLEGRLLDAKPLADRYQHASTEEDKHAIGNTVLAQFFPTRFTDAWFRDNVRAMSQNSAMFNALLLELYRRNWTRTDIDARMLPYYAGSQLPEASFPGDITDVWLSENRATVRDGTWFTVLLLELFRRKWTLDEIGERVLPHYVGKSGDAG